jgi:hypothetical protein
MHFYNSSKFISKRNDINLPWILQQPPHPIQKDTFNCGVYVLVFYEQLLFQNQIDLPKSLTAFDLNKKREDIFNTLQNEHTK